MNYLKSENEVQYWKFFNACIRFIGFIFFFAGIAFGIWGGIMIINSKASAIAMPPDDFLINLLIYFVFPFFTLTGFLAMKLEPYFPEHIKKRMQEEKEDTLR